MSGSAGWELTSFVAIVGDAMRCDAMRPDLTRTDPVQPEATRQQTNVGTCTETFCPNTRRRKAARKGVTPLTLRMHGSGYAMQPIKSLQRAVVLASDPLPGTWIASVAGQDFLSLFSFFFRRLLEYLKATSSSSSSGTPCKLVGTVCRLELGNACCYYQPVHLSLFIAHLRLMHELVLHLFGQICRRQSASLGSNRVIARQEKKKKQENKR